MASTATSSQETPKHKVTAGDEVPYMPHLPLIGASQERTREVLRKAMGDLGDLDMASLKGIVEQLARAQTSGEGSSRSGSGQFQPLLELLDDEQNTLEAVADCLHDQFCSGMVNLTTELFNAVMKKAEDGQYAQKKGKLNKFTAVLAGDGTVYWKYAFGEACEDGLDNSDEDFFDEHFIDMCSNTDLVQLFFCMVENGLFHLKSDRILVRFDGANECWEMRSDYKNGFTKMPAVPKKIMAELCMILNFFYAVYETNMLMAKERQEEVDDEAITIPRSVKTFQEAIIRECMSEGLGGSTHIEVSKEAVKGLTDFPLADLTHVSLDKKRAAILSLLLSKYECRDYDTDQLAQLVLPKQDQKPDQPNGDVASASTSSVDVQRRVKCFAPALGKTANLYDRWNAPAIEAIFPGRDAHNAFGGDPQTDNPYFSKLERHPANVTKEIVLLANGPPNGHMFPTGSVTELNISNAKVRVQAPSQSLMKPGTTTKKPSVSGFKMPPAKDWDTNGTLQDEILNTFGVCM